MFSSTSLTAIRTLILLAEAEPGALLSIRGIAEKLGESPTYLAKVGRLLVRAGILRATKGIKGGVQLGRPASQISLLEVVEACQGAIIGSYCQPGCPREVTCAFHEAAMEVERAIVGTLAGWNLAQLASRRRPAGVLPGGAVCLMERAARGIIR